MEKGNVTLTDRAANHIKNYLAKQGTSISLRVGVRPTGCSGFQYVVGTADNHSETDKVFQSQGINIVIDRQSLPYLAGTELDYVREGINEGFRFNNPNVDKTCGCGESFNVKENTTETH